MKITKESTKYSIGDMVYFMCRDKIERGIVFSIQYIKTELPFENFDNLSEEPFVLQKIVEGTIDKRYYKEPFSIESCAYKIAVFEHNTYKIKNTNCVICLDENYMFPTKEMLVANLCNG